MFLVFILDFDINDLLMVWCDLIMYYFVYDVFVVDLYCVNEVIFLE